MGNSVNLPHEITHSPYFERALCQALEAHPEFTNREAEELLSRGLGITWRDTQPPKKGRWKRDLQRHFPRLFGRGRPYKTPQPEGAPRPGKPVLHDLCGWGDGDLNQWEDADLVAVEILHQLRGDHAAVLLLFEMWARGTDIQDALDVVAAATAAGA